MAVKKVRSKKKWSTGKLEKMQSERERKKSREEWMEQR